MRRFPPAAPVRPPIHMQRTVRRAGVWNQSSAYDPGMERERDTQDESQSENEDRSDDERLDEALEESFPASDPIAPEAPER